MGNFTGGAGPDRLLGTLEADTLDGLQGADTIVGFAGDDVIRGGFGVDDVNAGPGRDRIDGGAGGDSLLGGDGRDTINGQAGGDVIKGGRSADQLFGQGGRDSMLGGNASDELFGGGGRDTMLGGRGRDTMAGGAGRDELFGGGSRDLLRGGAGDDSIAGGNGGDELRGGADDDLLMGGRGDDLLYGGRGADRFVFTDDAGDDRIGDYEAADTIDLAAVDVDFDDLTITDVADGALIEYAEGSILLEGAQAADLEEGDFAFRAPKPVIDDGGDGSKVDTQITPGFDAKASGEIGAQSNDGAGFTGLTSFRADARFQGIDGAGYSVVVIDTGIDLNHPAFGRDADRDGVSDRIVFSQDFSDDRDGTADDRNGHGSNVSSIIGSEDPRFLGVAPGVNIIALQGLANSGSGTARGIEAAVQWAVDNAQAYNIVAVNMSLGPPDNLRNPQANSFLGDEFAALASLDIVTTVAAGNNFFEFQTPGVQSIAADPNVIAVGAVWDDNVGGVEFVSGAKDFSTAADRITSFSQRSDDFGLIFAPGGGITGAAPGGGTVTQSGTSQAAPFVAGVAALAQDLAIETLGRRLSPNEFQRLLLDAADTINDGDDENDNVANTGLDLPRVNVQALGEAILALGGTEPAPNPRRDDDIAGDRSTTSVIDIGGVVESVIDTAADQDWHRIELEAGDLYRFAMTRDETEFDFLPDPTLVLRDASGAAVTSNDDSGGSLNAEITFAARTDGTFFLDAGGYDDLTGAYRLTAARLGAAPRDDFRDDNTTTAELRDDGVARTGSIEAPGDRDRFFLDVEAGASYLLQLEGAGGSALVDPFLRVYDDESRLIAANDDGGEDRASALLFEASETGRIFVEAAAFGDDGAGGYSLTADIQSSAPGDPPADETTTARVDVGGTFDGVLETAGDRDWIGVELVGGGVYEVTLAGIGANELPDPLLRIFDPDGRQVAINDDFDGRDSRIEDFVADRSGLFFLSAGAFADAGEGAYRVAIDQIGSGGDAVPGDGSTTAVIDIGGTVGGVIDEPGDRDWYRVSLTEGDEYEISLTGVGDDSLRDPFLRVYDGASALVASDDDGGPGLNSLLTFTATDSGDFFLAAGAFSDRSDGDYELGITRIGGGGSGDDFGDDITSGVGVIPVNGSRAGVLEQSFDTDVFSVDLVAGRQYRFDVFGASGGGGDLSDPTLTLLDRFGDTIIFNDDGGFGRDPAITFRAEETARHFLAVNGFFGDFGSYEVSAAEFSLFDAPQAPLSVANLAPEKDLEADAFVFRPDLSAADIL